MYFKTQRAPGLLTLFVDFTATPKRRTSCGKHGSTATSKWGVSQIGILPDLSRATLDAGPYYVHFWLNRFCVLLGLPPMGFVLQGSRDLHTTDSCRLTGTISFPGCGSDPGSRLAAYSPAPGGQIRSPPHIVAPCHPASRRAD